MKLYYDSIQDLLKDAGWEWDKESLSFTRGGQAIPYDQFTKHTAGSFHNQYPDLCKEAPKSEEDSPSPYLNPDYDGWCP